jgi:Flp pilus assembly protein TadD
LIQVAIADEPDNQAYRDSLGWVYYQRGQYREAVKELEKAAAAKKPDGVVFDHLGDAYLKAGQAPKAKDAWRKAVKLLRQGQEKDEKKALEIEKKLK